jgi:hypothetical protein
MHVFRWDLDRTYLETEIHSWRGLVRAYIETAEEKRTIPGAAALLRGLQQGDPRARVCVISGSPTQMRAVLARKLELDGVRVDRLILKDNLRNLRKGRLRAVRAQIEYKLPYLLEDRLETPPHATETLFGDDAEFDALIYTAYAEILSGRVGQDVLVRLLRESGAYPDAIDRAVAALRKLAVGAAVDDIFIRIDRGLPLATYTLLGARVLPVFSWFQAAVVLWKRGRLSLPAVRAVADASGPPDALGRWLVDGAKRGLFTVDAARELIASAELEPLAPSASSLLDRLEPIPALEARESGPDLFGFFEATRR